MYLYIHSDILFGILSHMHSDIPSEILSGPVGEHLARHTALRMLVHGRNVYTAVV